MLPKSLVRTTGIGRNYPRAAAVGTTGRPSTNLCHSDCGNGSRQRQSIECLGLTEMRAGPEFWPLHSIRRPHGRYYGPAVRIQYSPAQPWSWLDSGGPCDRYGNAGPIPACPFRPGQARYRASTRLLLRTIFEFFRRFPARIDGRYSIGSLFWITDIVAHGAVIPQPSMEAQTARAMVS